jgi:hypothetical protein
VARKGAATTSVLINSPPTSGTIQIYYKPNATAGRGNTYKPFCLSSETVLPINSNRSTYQVKPFYLSNRSTFQTQLVLLHPGWLPLPAGTDNVVETNVDGGAFEELLEDFYVVATGWTDNQLPLRYRFVFLQQGEVDETPFTQIQSTTSKSVRLPAGLISIKVYVYDAMNDYTEFTYADNIRVGQINQASVALQALEAESVFWQQNAAEAAVQPQQQLRARKRRQLLSYDGVAALDATADGGVISDATVGGAETAAGRRRWGSTSTYKPFYLSSETVLPIKRNRSTYLTVLPFKLNLCRYNQAAAAGRRALVRRLRRHR